MGCGVVRRRESLTCGHGDDEGTAQEKGRKRTCPPRQSQDAHAASALFLAQKGRGVMRVRRR